jgi:hypothetical protein
MRGVPSAAAACIAVNAEARAMLAAIKMRHDRAMTAGRSFVTIRPLTNSTKSHVPLLMCFRVGCPSWTIVDGRARQGRVVRLALWPPGRGACAMSRNSPSGVEGDGDDGVITPDRTNSYFVAMRSVTPEVREGRHTKLHAF